MEISTHIKREPLDEGDFVCDFFYNPPELVAQYVKTEDCHAEDTLIKKEVFNCGDYYEIAASSCAAVLESGDHCQEERWNDDEIIDRDSSPEESVTYTAASGSITFSQVLNFDSCVGEENADEKETLLALKRRLNIPKQTDEILEEDDQPLAVLRKSESVDDDLPLAARIRKNRVEEDDQTLASLRSLIRRTAAEEDYQTLAALRRMIGNSREDDESLASLKSRLKHLSAVGTDEHEPLATLRNRTKQPRNADAGTAHNLRSKGKQRRLVGSSFENGDQASVNIKNKVTIVKKNRRRFRMKDVVNECVFCDVTFESAADWWYHVKSHGRTSYPCKCGSVHLRLAILRKHLRQYIDKPPLRRTPQRRKLRSEDDPRPKDHFQQENSENQEVSQSEDRGEDGSDNLYELIEHATQFVKIESSLWEGEVVNEEVSQFQNSCDGSQMSCSSLQDSGLLVTDFVDTTGRQVDGSVEVEGEAG